MQMTSDKEIRYLPTILSEIVEIFYVQLQLQCLKLSCASFVRLGPRFHLAIFPREQGKDECDWLVMTSVFVVNQSSCFFSIRANKFASWKTGLLQMP